MLTRDQPLRVELLDGRLVVSIGIDVLKHAIEFDPRGSGPEGESVEITDPDQFAAELAAALGEEAEDGTTPVHRMLDAAASRAIENGAEGVVLRVDGQVIYGG